MKSHINPKGKDAWPESGWLESIKLRVSLSNRPKNVWVYIITIHFFGRNFKKPIILVGENSTVQT